MVEGSLGGYTSDNATLVVQGIERKREEGKEGGREREVNVNGGILPQ